MPRTSYSRPLVLYVDDVAADREAIGRVVRSFGYEVELANTAEQALEKFAHERFAVDVVMLDLDLRGSNMDGLELLQKLKELRTQRGYGLRPELLCLTAVWLGNNDLNKVTAAGGRYIRKGLPDMYRIELANAITRMNDASRYGVKILIKHRLPSPSRRIKSYRERMLLCEGKARGAYFITNNGPVEITGLKGVELIFLDLFAYLAAEKPKTWKDIVECAYGMRFFSEQLAAARHMRISTGRDALKETVFRIRHALSASANEIDLGMSGDEILVSYYRNPITHRLMRLEKRDQSRNEVKRLRKKTPDLKRLLVEDKSSHYHLDADVYIEESLV